MHKNIAAYTAVSEDATPISFPEFISLNREADGKLYLTARERGHNGTKSVKLMIPDDEALKFAGAVIDNVAPVSA